jgi:AraC-like DNA-binding protein
LSVIAHGDSEVLARSEHWLRTHHGLRPELDNWGRVLQHVAGQLLQTADTLGCSVSELQRQFLVPLELAVTLTPVGPATLYRLVNAMLSDLRSQIGIERA